MLGRFSSRKIEMSAPLAGVHPHLLAEPVEPAVPAAPALVHHELQQSDDYLRLKVELHHHLIDRFNLSTIEQLDAAQLQEQIRPIVRDYIREHAVPLNAVEIDTLVSDTADEMLGLGPLEPLLKDDGIADILINTHRNVYIERGGRLERTAVRFSDEAHLMRIVNKIVAGVGRRVDESSPLVDARLADGSRVNVAIRPVSIDGPLVSIRKFSRQP
jgi:pilus assembly protein CpaF